jgi:molybdopterin-containing oxidoreductase family iron-sulfur binding subunit
MLELQLRPDAKLFDGRFALNGWLQELPDPLTTRSWGNAIELSTATAAALAIATGDLVELTLPSGTTVTSAAYVSPAHPDGAATLPLGYGRAAASSLETATSVAGFGLRSGQRQWSVGGATLRRAGGRGELILRQPQQSMEGREPVRAGALDGYLANPRFLANERPAVSLYPETRRTSEYRWALSIDLNRCIGCAACTVACQAENNIPVVGKEQAALGRTMHWIRVDRYHDGAGPSARTLVQPVPCMHCENAPCEYVCPVGATVHDSEGLNVMVYNRCIGTRDCSQNCPYKVRRFNWLDYNYGSAEDWAPLRNPNVTVRSRGVMEKCSYCVQRISAARQTAEIENRRIRDGEVVTACQAVCPVEAIVFGDLNTADSAINARRADPRDYTLLAELNTRPRTTYLARVDNPNPDLADGAA